MEWGSWVLVAAASLVAGTMGGAVGFGSAVILLPVCTYAFGAALAVPVLTLAALVGNLSRAWFSWGDTDWPAVRAYSAGAVPAAAVGAFIFVQLDTALIQRLLGVFIIAMVPARRWATARGIRVRRSQLTVVGTVMGLLSGIVGTTGPINAPFFLSYGLSKGAYLATEALGTSFVHVAKAVVYGRFAALTTSSLTVGAAIGVMLIVGSYLGRRIVERLDVAAFQVVVEILLVGSGIVMLMIPSP